MPLDSNGTYYDVMQDRKVRAAETIPLIPNHERYISETEDATHGTSQPGIDRSLQFIKDTDPYRIGHNTQPNSTVQPGDSANKDDEGKPMLSLIDRWFLWEFGRVLSFGASKYAADNWRKGLTVRRCLDAALRHITAFADGEDNDKESRLSHLGHAACSIMFAFCMWRDRPDLDDRYKSKQVWSGR